MERKLLLTPVINILAVVRVILTLSRELCDLRLRKQLFHYSEVDTYGKFHLVVICWIRILQDYANCAYFCIFCEAELICNNETVRNKGEFQELVALITGRLDVLVGPAT